MRRTKQTKKKNKKKEEEALEKGYYRLCQTAFPFRFREFVSVCFGA